MSIIISGILTVFFGIILNYICLPAWTLSSGGLWFYFISLFLFFAACNYFLLNFIDEEDIAIKGIFIGGGGALGIFVIYLILCLSGSPLFNSTTYANTIEVKDVDSNMIPTVDDLAKIPLMDTNSAKKLGDRTIGVLTDLVSQYEVSENYTTITYQDKVYKIAPLEYAGLFKYNNNKYNGIPGYVLVDTENNVAEYIKLEKGFKISNSAYFSNNLKRVLRNQYPTFIFGNSNFQIDEEGHPYWITSVVKPRAVLSGSVIKGVIITDAMTGSTEYYEIKDTPEWIDYVYNGDTISKYYNWYGYYQEGFWNSIISQRNVTQTTDDFGYISKDNDIWVYTGITSVNTDESNLGFIMANSRTGECLYIKCDGAEEYSAMSAAEGVVQNYGYKASFPALITIENEPTYALVLKDANGLIKQYAFINVRNYTIVTTAEKLEKAYQNYITLLKGEVIEEETNISNNNTNTIPNIPEENSIKVEIIVDKIDTYMINGNTYFYLYSGEKVYKQSLIQNENIIFIKPNDKIILNTLDTQNNIIDAILINE